MIDLRDAIENVKKDVLREKGGEATNEAILSKVRTLNASEIKELTDQLVNIALTKLLNDVSNRKGPKSMTGDGIDLFGTYQGIPKSITLMKGRKKDITKLTFTEADLWIRAHDIKRNDRNEKLRRLVEECREYRESDEDTLEIAMQRKLKKERLSFKG